MAFLIIDVLLKGVRKAIASLSGLRTSFKLLRGDIDGMNKSWAKSLGLGLGLLFFGLQLKRVFGIALRGILATFTEVLGEQNELNIATLKLQAAFKFLQFAIADALAQSGLFAFLVDVIVSIIDFLSGMNSTVLLTLGLFVLFGLILGTISFALGTIFLFANAVGISLAALGLVILFLVGLAGLWAVIWSSNLSIVAKVFLTLVTIFIAGLLAMTTGAGFAAITMATVFAAAFAAIILNSDLLVASLGFAFGALALGILLVIDTIENAFVSFINGLIKGINLIIFGVNKVLAFLGQKTITLVPELTGFGFLDSAIQGTLNKMQNFKNIIDSFGEASLAEKLGLDALAEKLSFDAAGTLGENPFPNITGAGELPGVPTAGAGKPIFNIDIPMTIFGSIGADTPGLQDFIKSIVQEVIADQLEEGGSE